MWTLTILLTCQLLVAQSAPQTGVISSSPGNLAGCPPGQVCVAFNLCKDNNVVKDGTGLLDVRFDDEEVPGGCLQYYEICCTVYDKEDTTTSAPPLPTRNEIEKCGVRNNGNVHYKISGGDQESETKFAEFPWMVAILTEEVTEDQIELNIYQCGGSLISPKVVLTAAHCVFGRTADSLKVRAGEWDTQRKKERLPHQDRFIAEIVIHEHFSRNSLHNDVALLILDSALELAENVRTVCLTTSRLAFDSSNCVATGWGKDAYGKVGKYSNVLKKVELPTVDQDVCQESLRNTRLGPYFQLHSSFICAGGEKGKDTCKGDGGSPLVCPIVGQSERYYQVGVVAWGIGCGDDIPAVYANVMAIRGWIDRQFVHYGLDNKYYLE